MKRWKINKCQDKIKTIKSCKEGFSSRKNLKKSFYLVRALIRWMLGILLMGYLTQTDALSSLSQDGFQVRSWNDAPLATATETRFAAATDSAHTLYVSTSGADSNSGQADSPFRTIQHAIDAARAGDTVLIQGGTYYERQIDFHTSGEKDNPITVKSAPGSQVIIDHGLQTGDWKNIGGSVYQASVVMPDPGRDNIDFTKRIVVDHQALLRVDSQDALKEGTFWIDTSSGKVSLWAPGGATPTQQNTVLINWNDQFKTGIKLFDQSSHIVIDGITDRGAQTGIWAANWQNGNAQDIVIQNCEITAAWDGAIRFDSWNQARVSNCNIHNVALIQAPRNSGVNWPHAIVGWKANQITIDHNKIHDNNGEGVGPTHGCNDWIIRDNEVFDNWSVNIYIDTDGGNIQVDGNLVYNTGKYQGAERDRPDAIRISNETADFGIAGASDAVHDVSIVNNVILNTGSGIRYLNYRKGPSYLTRATIANNTIHGVDSNTDAIYLTRADDVKVINNIVDAGNIELQEAMGKGITASHNLIPTANTIITGGENIQVTDSVIGAPKYTVGRGHIAENYQIREDSPAKNAGINLQEVPHDYSNNARSSKAIGAFR